MKLQRKAGWTMQRSGRNIRAVYRLIRILPQRGGVADGSSLPTGLSLNRETGTIGGTPTESGKYTFSVTAECADMITAKEFNLTVLPEGGCLHEELTCIPGTAATCMKDGVADYYYCGFCDRYYKDEQCKKQIWDIEYALKSELKTAARHTDENNDGVCDFAISPCRYL